MTNRSEKRNIVPEQESGRFGEQSFQEKEARDQQFQEKVRNEIEELSLFRTTEKNTLKNPRLFDYSQVAQVFNEFSAQETALALGADDSQRAQFKQIFTENISRPYTELFKRTKPTEQEQEEARAFHVGYVAGQIERELPQVDWSVPEKRRRLHLIVDAVLFMKTNDEAKIMALKHSLERAIAEFYREEGNPDKIPPTFDTFLIENSWLLGDFDKADKLLIDVNLAGKFATEALIAFAKEIFPDMSRKELIHFLQETLNVSDTRLAEYLSDEGDPRYKKIIQFAARAANNAWIFSKIPQGLLEQYAVLQSKPNAFGEKEESKRARLSDWQESKPSKGAGRYTLGEKQNKYFSTFDKMEKLKGWPAVLLDIDQIRTGLSLLIAQERGE